MGVPHIRKLQIILSLFIVSPYKPYNFMIFVTYVTEFLLVIYYNNITKHGKERNEKYERHYEKYQ